MPAAKARNKSSLQSLKITGAASKKNSVVLPGNDMKSKYAIMSVAAVLLLTAIVYAGSLTNGFINNWDDNIYILRNPYFKALSWATVKTLFSSFYQGNYSPLTMLSYSVDYLLWGLNPPAFHAINLVLHLLNVLLVFRLFQMLTKRSDVALFVALLFGIHPMHVESVAWISERKDVLYAFFYLAAIIAYIYYLQNKGRYLYLAISFCLFLFSLFSKSMAVTLPLLMLLFDYYLERKRSWTWLIEKIPFFILSLLFGILAIKSQTASEAITDISPIFTAAQRVLIFCYSLVFYLVKLFAPFALSALYYYPVEASKAALNLEYFAAPIVLIILIFLIRKSGRYRKDILFGILFFMITISVVLQIRPVGQAMVADRYTYIPFLGFFFILAKFYNNATHIKKQTYSVRAGVRVIFVLIVVMFSVLTWQRSRVWKDGVTLFSDVIKYYPNSFYSYNVRGVGYMETAKPDLDAALKDFSRCIDLNPAYSVPYKSRGNIFYKRQRYNEAMADFNSFLKTDSNDAEGYSDRGAARFGMQDWKGTITDCSNALRFDPSITSAWINRGNARGMMNDYLGSVEDYNQVIMRDPSQSGAYLNRGISLMALGKMKEACMDWNTAKQLGNNNADGLISKNCK